ncbi:MAG TPA: DNA N-6-adenine-methyltransferase [Pirellulales bacterium]|nr:DNA N-6-adenine-methyltransferase [Pirellulales bacterium]
MSKDWCTPRKYVDAVRECLGQIELDPCSNQNSIVQANVEYCLPARDGLTESWDFKTVYVNPPYGADREHGSTIKHWLRRCAVAADKGSEVLALVPVATNTAHWKQFVWGRAIAVAFLYDTRLKFLVDGKDGGKGAPMSCAMVYWGNHYPKFERIFFKFGAVVDLRSLHGKKIGTAFDRPAELF